MTRGEILRMAEEAVLDHDHINAIVRFANVISDRVREECAKLAESEPRKFGFAEWQPGLPIANKIRAMKGGANEDSRIFEGDRHVFSFTAKALVHFAHLIADHVREEIVTMCESEASEWMEAARESNDMVFKTGISRGFSLAICKIRAMKGEGK